MPYIGTKQFLFLLPASLRMEIRTHNVVFFSHKTT
jgi:trehalose-6-phosphate synthase